LYYLFFSPVTFGICGLFPANFDEILKKSRQKTVLTHFKTSSGICFFTAENELLLERISYVYLTPTLFCNRHTCCN
jgi:hypothetical protein